LSGFKIEELKSASNVASFAETFCMGRIYVKTNAVVSVSYPGFPEPETRVFWLFSTSPNPGI